MYKRRRVAKKRKSYGKRRSGVFRGRGDYIAGSTAAPIINQLVGGSGQKPIRVNTGGDLSGDVYIHHREFVGNVLAQYTNPSTVTAGTYASDFNNVEFPLNPGLMASFPWLSQLAQNFTLFEFLGLVLEYRPTSSEYGSTQSNALGKVIMATDYDPDAVKFANSVSMENYDYATSCKPSEHMAHGVETKPTSTAVNMMYVRTGVSQKDKVFTDLGLFQMGTEGIPINVTTTTAGYVTKSIIGELWVTYKVKLSRANLYGALLYQNVPYDYLSAGSNVAGSIGGLAPGLNPGAYYYQTGKSAANLDFACLNSNNIGVEVRGSSGGAKTMTLTWPTGIIQGQYQVTLWFTNVKSAAAPAAWPVNPTGWTFANCNLYTKNPPVFSSGLVEAAPVSSGIIVSNTTAAEAGVSPTPCSTMIFWVQVNAPGSARAQIVLSLQTGVTDVTTGTEWVAIISGVPNTVLMSGI